MSEEIISEVEEEVEEVEEEELEEGEVISREKLMKQSKSIQVMRNGVKYKVRKGALKSFLDSGWTKVK